MIGVRDAVKAALAAFEELYEGRALDPLLEEVERSEDERSWDVTIGFNVLETEPASPLEEILAQSRGVAVADRRSLRRRYRVVRVDAASGALQSMKVREL